MKTVLMLVTLVLQSRLYKVDGGNVSVASAAGLLEEHPADNKVETPAERLSTTTETDFTPTRGVSMVTKTSTPTKSTTERAHGISKRSARRMGLNLAEAPSPRTYAPIGVGFPVFRTRDLVAEAPSPITYEPIGVGFPVFRTRVLVTETTSPRTYAPMVVGFPVFRTRVLVAETIPPKIVIPIIFSLASTATTVSTTTTTKKVIPVTATTQLPTTLTVPTTTVKRTTSTTTTTTKKVKPVTATTQLPTTITIPTSTTKRTLPPTSLIPTTLNIPTTTIKRTTFITTTTQPRTESIGFPVSQANFVLSPTPPPEEPATKPLTTNATKKLENKTTPAVEVETTTIGIDKLTPAQSNGSTKSIDIDRTIINETALLTATPHPAKSSGGATTPPDTSDVGPPIFRNRSVLNETIGGERIVVVSLCGYPPYNDQPTCHKLDYFSDPLLQCEEEWGRILFSVLVGIAAAAILSVNGLIILIIARNSDMRTHYDSIKVSLAIADAIIGFLLFISVLPNSMRIRRHSEQEIIEFIVDDVNSPEAVIAGSLLSVTMQASILHLCFLSIERFLSINVSFWHLRRKTSSIKITLAVIWIVSLVAAFLPAVSPEYFEYKLQPALLIHMLTLKPKAGTTTVVGHEGLIYVMFTMVLPYIVTVIFCISTGVVTYRKLTASKKYFGNDHVTTSAKSTTLNSKSAAGTFSPVCQASKRNLKPEISVFITILIMIGAFTITLMPFAVVVGLFVAGLLDCDNYTIPYVVTFYFGLLNSLANGVIYSVRDPRFRSSVKNILSCEHFQTISRTFPSHSSHSSRV